MSRTPRFSDTLPRHSIVIGSDTELGNFLLGVESATGTGRMASRALLGEIDGRAPRNSAGRCNCPSCQQRRQENQFNGGWDPQDWGRKWLASNGGCAYIDLDHLEVCTPEVRGAHDFVAAWHAMLRIARRALHAVNAQAPEGVRAQVLVNNSDGLGNSYGGHLSFLVRRRTWEHLFHRKMHHLLYLAAHQVSSIVYTGQGKVGSENGAPAVRYQLSQRADFFETLVAEQTTYRRPIVNSRDEPLCGHSGRGDAAPARLHVIFYDSNLCQAACLLKVGAMQVVLAMLEAGRLNPQQILDDPLEAVRVWSHDPTLKARARTASGRRTTAVDHQRRFLDEARKFHRAGGCDGIVPRADEILDLWGDTLDKLRARDFDALAGRLDWVLKQMVLERALAQHRHLDWDSPQLKHLDHLYSNLDPAQGLHWMYDAAGVVQHVVEDEQIERFVHEPPDDTRAWTRAMLLRQAEDGRLDHIDWDSVRLRLKTPGGWPSYPSVTLADPLSATRSEMEPLFDEPTLADTVEAIRRRLDEASETPATTL